MVRNAQEGFIFSCVVDAFEKFAADDFDIGRHETFGGYCEYDCPSELVVKVQIHIPVVPTVDRSFFSWDVEDYQGEAFDR